MSVLVPVHGHEAYLDATMVSLLEQTHQDFEVVALDDGSRDGSRAVLDRYAGDPRVRVLTQENIGWTGRLDLPFNRLVQEARGELIAWLGGDDVSRPDRIAAQVAVFDDDPGVDVCHGAAEAIDVSGAPLGLVWGLERGYDDASALRAMLVGNLVGHPSVMMRRSAHDRIGGFADGLVCDYQLWLRAAGHLRFRYLPHRLVGYRQHPASLSTSAEGAPRSAREAQRVRRAAVERSSLDQLFPELADGAGPRARYEAVLSLANELVPVDPVLALAVYDLVEGGGGFEVVHNRALAHAVAGDHDAALASARAAAVSDPRGADLLDALTVPGRGEVGLLAPRAALDDAVARAREDGRHQRWDGASSTVRSAWVGLDPRRPDVMHLALEVWAELTRAGQPLRWVLPDLGRGEEQVAGEIGEVLGLGGTDLSGAADVAVERVDNLALLPPDPGRATGLLSTPRDVEVFASWVRGAVADAV